MGRRKNDANLKVLHGTARKDRANPNEPRPSSERPEPPKDLDPIALQEWHKTVAELELMGLMARCDHAALEAYCSVYAHWKINEATLRREGDVIVYPNGAKGPHPSFRIVTQCLTLMRQYLIEFGMSPASRSNVKTPKKSETVNRFSLLRGGSRRN